MPKPPRQQGNYVIGPDGSPLTIADLPPPGTKRWVPRRKAEVVAAVRGGLLSFQEACSRYSLTVDEFRSWQDFDRPIWTSRFAHNADPTISSRTSATSVVVGDAVARSPPGGSPGSLLPIVHCDFE